MKAFVGFLKDVFPRPAPWDVLIQGEMKFSTRGGQCSDATGAPRSSFYLQSLLVGASNSKAVLFFSAFFPQF